MGSHQMTSLDFPHLEQTLVGSRLKKWAPALLDMVQERGDASRDRRLLAWTSALENLPLATPSSITVDQSVIRIGASADLSMDAQAALGAGLRSFLPWRKGPFDFFGIHIDTEWRSDLKWDRVVPHISDLRGRTVLDVGCGSGYHCWRMRGAGANLVIGIDPSLLFCVQFQAVQRYIQDHVVQVLPLRLDELPVGMGAFQTTFSMGVLYHRRSPFDHLVNLRNTLQPGGELVLETLVVDGPLHHVLVPEDRYAQMRNVWCLPSTLTLEHWMRRVGFRSVRTVNLNDTAEEEQRKTEWMEGHSLRNFLDPNDPTKTIEGYPAPKRAILIAER